MFLLELLEGFDAAGDDDDIVGLRCGEEVFCNGKTDAWIVAMGVLLVSVAFLSCAWRWFRRTSRGTSDDDGFGGHVDQSRTLLVI